MPANTVVAGPVSDCAAIADVFLPTSHNYAKTPAEGVAVSLKAAF